MATRTGERPARDRLTAAQHRLDTAKGIHRVHLKICDQCHRAGADTARLCDEGWQQLVIITRCGNQVRKLTEQSQLQGAQGVLF